MAQTSKNPIERAAFAIDALQRRYHAFSFPHAVVKKYGDDQAGQQAALITYYGFLSLFPLMLVATSVVDIIAQHNMELRARILGDINTYLPVIGQQLQDQVQASDKTGLALVAGLLVALYGTRGIANALRSLLDHAWSTPKARRSGFLPGGLKSFALLLGGGVGILLTSGLAGYATAALAGHSFLTRVVPIVINVCILYLLLIYVFTVGPSRRRPRADVQLGAVLAAVGLLTLQTVGSYLVTHRLHDLRGLYGQFALVLATLFWLYLQAQVLVYAIEINVVHARRLWPRSMTGHNLTAADRKAYRLYAAREAYRPKDEEQIDVSFGPTEADEPHPTDQPQRVVKS